MVSEKLQLYLIYVIITVRMEALANLIPQWLREWLRIYVIPFLQIEGRKLLLAVLQGIGDAFLFLGLPLTISFGSQAILSTRYNLTPTQQQQINTWAGVANIVAYVEDVPPVVPLVLWYKEAGLRSENPANCEGIMGLYTAVSTGELPCFPPGSLGPWEIAHQLRLGARTFKEYCPEVTYITTDPRVLKRCYLYYNAGPQSRMNPNTSAYVMNGYDAAHQNMVHTDIEGRRYRLQAVGAWPIHLSIQAQLSQQGDPIAPPAILAPMLVGQELFDRLWVQREAPNIVNTTRGATRLTCRDPQVTDCFIEPQADGQEALRPTLSPLQIPPIRGGKLNCGLLPGTDLAPPQPSIVLAPMSGHLSRYTDKEGHLAVQIENEAWSIWLTGLRSYTAPPGDVEAGEPIGAIGGMDSLTPAIHYTIYDKLGAGFVDPMGFMPAEACPPAG